MSKIVELCGGPGVGKSTIYKHLSKHWRKTDNWIPAEYLFPYVKTNYKPLLNFIKRVSETDFRKEDVRSMRNAGSRFISKHPEYIEACINKILVIDKKNLNGSDQRFEKAGYMYSLIKKVQICRESSCRETVIIEEGLISAIRNAIPKTEDTAAEKKELLHLLNVMPLPDALVYVETDLDENVKRLFSRKKIIPSFEGIDRDELIEIIRQFRITWKIAISLLESKNIPVLHLDSNDSPATNALKIKSFVTNSNKI